MAVNQAGQARVFLSYARRDGEAADRLFDALTDAGVEIFRDSKDILPAEDWRGRLQGLIRSADAILFLVSPNSVRSEVCAWELETASALNKRLVPVAVAETGDAPIPDQIERLNYIFARAGDDLGAAVDAIRSAVETDIAWVREHTRLYERALEWDQQGGKARLLRGEPLEAAERWLAEQPSTGPAPLALHRTWIGASRKGAVARQRGWVAGALAVAALSIGLGIFAEINRQIAAEQRDRAERILDRGSKTANDLVFDLAQRFRDREGIPQDLVLDILGRSKNLVDQLADAGEGRPDLLRSRAAALTELSLTLLRQGDAGGALQAAEQAASSFRAIAEVGEGAPRARADLAVSLDRIGDVHLANGDLERAEAAYQEAMVVNQALAGSDGAEFRENLGVSHEKLGSLRLAVGDGDGALAHFEKALSWRAAGEGARGRAILLERIGDSHLLLDDIAGASEHYQRSLQVTERLSLSDPGDTKLLRDLSVIHQKLGDLALTQGQRAVAIEHFRADLAIAERLQNADPARLDWLSDLAVSHDRLGVAYYQDGDPDGAEQAFRAAWEAATELAVRQPANAASQLDASKAAQKLSLVAFANGDAKTSLSVSQAAADALASFHQRAGDLPDAYADALNNVAWYALFANDPARAADAARAAIAAGGEKPGYALNLAHAHMLGGDTEAALAVHRLHANAQIGGAAWRDVAEADLATLRDAGASEALVAPVVALFRDRE